MQTAFGCQPGKIVGFFRTHQQIKLVNEKIAKETCQGKCSSARGKSAILR